MPAVVLSCGAVVALVAIKITDSTLELENANLLSQTNWMQLLAQLVWLQSR